MSGSAAAGLRLLPADGGDPAAMARLAALATAAYLPHYADLWTDGGLGYAARAFAPARLAALAGDPRVRLRLITARGEPAGFAQWQLPAAALIDGATGEPGCAAVYLERLYLLRSATGLGLGAAVLAAVEDDAREQGLAAVWLRAMSCRPALVAYYRRHGYEPVGEDRLDAPGVVAGREGMVRLLKRVTVAAGS